MYKLIDIKFNSYKKTVSVLILVFFLFSVIAPVHIVYAQNLPSFTPKNLNLPIPGAMIDLSPAFNPTIMKGIRIFPDNPLKFDFIMDKGDASLEAEELKIEYNKLIKYFLAALTVPEENLWVNLSPLEANRIIPNDFGKTEMGRDLLAQDYMLKQITASLVYPENELGREFWEKVYQKLYKVKEARMKNEVKGSSGIEQNFNPDPSTLHLSEDIFSKIWIVPERAAVSIKGDAVFVTDSYLKVMTDLEYFSTKDEGRKTKDETSNVSRLTSDVIKEIILPEIEKEVNYGKNFANLRQIYGAVIFATWFKQNLKGSFLGKTYFDQKKINGIDIEDKQSSKKIYERYLEAFKKGVFDYIKEDYDPENQEIIPRKYFSGGAALQTKVTLGGDIAMTGEEDVASVNLMPNKIAGKSDLAMSARIKLNPQIIPIDPNSGTHTEHIDRFFSKRELRDFSQNGIPEESINNVVDIWHPTNKLGFGLSHSFDKKNVIVADVDQKALIARDVRRLIKERVGKSQSFTFIQVGVGSGVFRETRDLLEAISDAFKAEGITEKEQKAWSVNFLALEYDKDIAKAFNENLTVLTELEYKLNIKIAPANARHIDELLQLSEEWKADFIVDRNRTYPQKRIDENKFKIDYVIKRGRVNNGVLNTYITIRNLLIAFAKEGTRYIVEQRAAKSKGKQFLIPGTRKLDVLDIDPDRDVEADSIDNTGTSYFEVINPNAMREKGPMHFIQSQQDDAMSATSVLKPQRIATAPELHDDKNQEIDSFLNEADINYLREYGMNDADIRSSIFRWHGTLKNGFGLDRVYNDDLQTARVDQKALIVKDMRSFIRARRGNNQVLTFIQVGLGTEEHEFIETRDLFKAINRAFEEEGVSEDEQRQWEINFLALDYIDRIVETFEEGIPHMQKPPYITNFRVAIVNVVNKDSLRKVKEEWEKELRKELQVDFVVDRNRTYANYWIDYGLLDIESAFITGRLSPHIMSPYLSIGNLLSVFAREGTRYIVEQKMADSKGRHFTVPGAEKLNARDIDASRDVASDHVDNTGTGYFRIDNPNAIKEKGIEEFIWMQQPPMEEMQKRLKRNLDELVTVMAVINHGGPNEILGLIYPLGSIASFELKDETLKERISEFSGEYFRIVSEIEDLIKEKAVPVNYRRMLKLRNHVRIWLGNFVFLRNSISRDRRVIEIGQVAQYPSIREFFRRWSLVFDALELLLGKKHKTNSWSVNLNNFFQEREGQWLGQANEYIEPDIKGDKDLDVKLNAEFLHLALERIFSNSRKQDEVDDKPQKIEVLIEEDESDPKMVNIIISNFGFIPEEDLDKLFEVDYDKRREDFSKGGVGMPLAALAMYRMGGKISAESDEETGQVVIKVSIPKYKEEDNAMGSERYEERIREFEDELDKLLKTEDPSPYRDTREKVLKAIINSTNNLSFEAFEGYQRIANELADKLVELRGDVNILAVIDGVTGGGKSTLTAYLLSALEKKDRSAGNWLELDDLLKSPEERKQGLERLAEHIDRGGALFGNQDENNYQTTAIRRYYKELNAFWSKGGAKDSVVTFTVAGVDRQQGRALTLNLIQGRDTVVENEYGIHFSSPLRTQRPVYIRVVKDLKEAKQGFLERTKISKGDVEDVSDGSDYMQKREMLFDSDAFTYELLAEETKDLVDIEVHLSGNPQDWKVVKKSDDAMGASIRLKPKPVEWVEPFNPDEELIERFLSGSEIKELRAYGLEENDILIPIRVWNQTQKEGLGLSKTDGHDIKTAKVNQQALITKDVQNLIQARKGTSNQRLTFIQVGLGKKFRETRDLLKAVKDAFEAEGISNEEQRRWTLNFLALEYDPGIYKKFRDGFQVLECPNCELNLQVANVNALDQETLQKLGQEWIADFIIDRNRTYANDNIEQGFYDFEKAVHVLALDSQSIYTYITVRNLFSAFARKGTRYIIEQKKADSSGRDFFVPGAKKLNVKRIDPSRVVDEKSIDNKGTGYFRIDNPRAIEEGFQKFLWLQQLPLEEMKDQYKEELDGVVLGMAVVAENGFQDMPSFISRLIGHQSIKDDERLFNQILAFKDEYLNIMLELKKILLVDINEIDFMKMKVLKNRLMVWVITYTQIRFDAIGKLEIASFRNEDEDADDTVKIIKRWELVLYGLMALLDNRLGLETRNLFEWFGRKSGKWRSNGDQNIEPEIRGDRNKSIKMIGDLFHLIVERIISYLSEQERTDGKKQKIDIFIEEDPEDSDNVNIYIKGFGKIPDDKLESLFQVDYDNRDERSFLGDYELPFFELAVRKMRGSIVAYNDEGEGQAVFKISMPLSSGDDAQQVGGIDLNPEQFEIQTQGDAIQYNFPTDLYDLESIQINGFTPVIIQILLITNFPMLLGETKSSNALELGKASLSK